MIIKLNAEYKKRLMESLRETVLLANNLKLEVSEREFYSSHAEKLRKYLRQGFVEA